VSRSKDNDYPEAPESDVPDARIRLAVDRPATSDGDWVVYWMTAQRRTRHNFALDRAVDWAKHLSRPLLVAEVLSCQGRWASDRHHRFILDGMADNRDELQDKPAWYHPFVESKAGRAAEFLKAVAGKAAVVVADDFPLPSPADPADSADELPVRVEKVDSNGLLPMSATDRDYPTAYAFRRFLQRVLPDHLLDTPKHYPLSRVRLPTIRSLPGSIEQRFPAASEEMLAGEASELARLPIGHDVQPVELKGGMQAARDVLGEFLHGKLGSYQNERNHPDADATSGCSPSLHHGHLSVHEAFSALARRENWSPDRLGDRATGKRQRWWGMGEAAEGFLDELITWREVGYNFCYHRRDFDRYESLPDWARTTLDEHRADRREHVYSLDEFARAATHDRLWNAAQTQLVREGRMHNYLRMLWGKKILHWTADPRDALEVMIELNNRYAVDAPNPNSYSGILWVLGRYDRAWGPERPIFGKIRYMTSDNTARKLRVDEYLDRYAPAGSDSD